MNLADHVHAALGAGGTFARQVPGFVPREAQLAFAEGVAHAISGGENLVAEAGTGTGKTFAYLVPILLSGRRAVIATATRALQDQLYEHDLPTVTQALGRPLEIRVLKGRTNYLCREKLNRFQPELGVGDSLDIEAVIRWDRVTETGDLAELPELGERPELQNRLTTDRHGCLGGQCPSYSGCHVYRARQRAREADVVIVNHHLLLADRALQAEGFSLLGDADMVVLDEAHALPDTARTVWGENLSFKQLGQLLGEADKRLSGRGNAVRALRDILAQGLPLAPGSHAREVLGEAVSLKLESVAETLVELDEELNLLDEEPTELRRRVLAALAILQAWMHPGTASGDDGASSAAGAVSRSIEVGMRGAVTLISRLIDTGQTFADWICASETRWIFSSATLAVGDDFSAFARDLGLEQPRTLKVQGAFDYENQARLYLPADLPDVDDAGYVDALMQAAEPLLTAAKGGAICRMAMTPRIPPVIITHVLSDSATATRMAMAHSGSEPRRP